MIAGIVTRTVNAVERRMEESKRADGHMLRSAAAALVFTVGVWAISQVGLMAIEKKGYAYLGYAGFVSVMIPLCSPCSTLVPLARRRCSKAERR